MSTDKKARYLFSAVKEVAQNYGIAALLAICILCLLPRFVTQNALYGIGILFIASVFAPFLRDWLPRPRLSSEGKAILITGCDSGFGNLLAQRLDDIGVQVFAGCLFPAGDGATQLQKSCSSHLRVVGLDVTKDDSVKEAVAFIKNNLNGNKLWAVVNNAGVNDGGELDWTNLDIIKRVIEINTIGGVRVAKAFLSLLRQSQGRIVTVASAAGRYTYPGMVPYCMSKQAAVSFSDGLRLEMYKWGVQVITIEPWMYKTPITNRDHILNYISRAWEKCPEETKKDYELNYIDKYRKKTLKTLNLSMKYNPHEVVDCMEEAILAESPKYSYSPGAVIPKFLFWFCEKLPKPVVDFIIYNKLR